MAAPEDKLMAPPTHTCPQTYSATVSLLEEPLRRAFSAHKVHWLIQSLTAAQGYTSTDDIAARYADRADIASKWETHYKLKETHQYTDAQVELALVRFIQVYLTCTSHRDRLLKDHTTTSHAPPQLRDGDRASLEQVYCNHTHLPTPHLEDQGSDAYMASQWKALQKGDIGDFTSKQIISALPEPGNKNQRRHKRHKGSDGLTYEFDEEVRDDPQDIDSWKHQMTIHRTTFLMCMYSTTHHPNVRIEKKDLDDYYDFIMGKAILQRKPPPTLRTLIISERKAWQTIRNKVHTGTKLKDALIEMRQDSLFWQREVYEYVRAKATPTQPTRNQQYRTAYNSYQRRTQTTGKGKYGNNSKGKGYNNNKGKGKGKYPPRTYTKGGKSKGKGKQNKGNTGKNNTSPTSSTPRWANADPNNKAYCMNYFMRKNCPGGCNRSHNCPAIGPNGIVCNQPHWPGKGTCPLY